MRMTKFYFKGEECVYAKEIYAFQLSLFTNDSDL